MRRDERPPVLYELFPARWDEEPVMRARTVFAGLAGIEGFALEFAASEDVLRFYLRAASDEVAATVLGQLRAAHPQMSFEPVTGSRDPVEVAAHEERHAVQLTLIRDAALPLDTDTRHGEPLAGVLAAAVAVAREGVRVIGQVVVGPPPPPRWSVTVRARAERRDRVRFSPAEPAPTSLLPLVGVAGVGGIGMQAYDWWQAGELLPLAASGAGMLVVLPLGGFLWSRHVRSREPLEPTLADQKLAFPAVTANVRLTVVGRRDESIPTSDIARRLAATYAAFDHPGGNGLRPRHSDASPPLAIRSRWLSPAPILNAAELAALWHLPCVDAGLPVSPKPGGRRFIPADHTVDRGCRVGVSRHQGREVPVHLPDGALFRNHLIVAKTRRGKSTFLQHIAAHLMRQIDSGRERVLLVVIDPHQDLGESVLSVAPPGLEDRTAYIDLTDRRRPIGLNLLDVALFPNRDRATENIVAMLHRLWPDNWGPRMEGALRAALLCLHQANQVRRREEQYTLLDVVPLLMSPEFRERVMSQVPDQTLWSWWRNNYDNLGRAFQLQIATPVTTKVGRFEVTEAARLTLGQARSTLNPRTLLRDGGVLVVNTAVGTLGEGGSALIGATLLNLVSLMVEDQIDLPAGQRSRMVALIDESSTLGGADYPRMMSELGKYGASFVLVTQSLSKLDAIDRELRPTIFANLDSLTVFQTSAEDARYLVPELGHDLEVDDLVSLDDYECYARWSVAGHRHSAFSLRLDPPAPLDRNRIAAIAARSAQRFGRARAEVTHEVDRLFAARAVKGGGTPPPAEMDSLESAGAVRGRPSSSGRNEHRDRRGPNDDSSPE
jgi:hypothetical protein